MSAPLIHHRLSVSLPSSPLFPLLFSSSLSLCLSNRAVASVLQGGCPGEQYRGEEALGMHSQHFVSRATNLREFLFLLFYVLGVLDAHGWLL